MYKEFIKIFPLIFSILLTEAYALSIDEIYKKKLKENITVLFKNVNVIPMTSDTTLSQKNVL
ncbi:hypothetical protein HY745_15375, partial [Candidatus Desantisbacteria bacterium]|nr:hypothetical protein [Candidatus Desantisbacteria bacterium]